MRTTLTLDPDVAAMIERLRKERNQSLKQVVNEALRAAFSQARSSRAKRKRYLTKPMNLGKCRFENLDNIQEILSIVEGDFRK